jgi:hypothetical protein
MIRTIALIITFKVAVAFFIEVEDTATIRKGNVWGLLALKHFERDNKLALIIEGPVP